MLDHLVTLAMIDGGIGGKDGNPYRACQVVNEQPVACFPRANDAAPLSLYMRE
jgi:hypothetical protein